MKKPISATIDTSLISWLDDTIKHNPIYRNKSHIIEIALEEYKLKLSSSKLNSQEKEAVKKK